MSFKFNFNISPYSSFDNEIFNLELLKKHFEENDVKVIDTNSTLKKNTNLKGRKVKITILDIPPTYSTENIVYFAEMQSKDFIQLEKRQICIKFNIPNEDNMIKNINCINFLTFNQKNANYVLFNYNLMEKFISNFPSNEGKVLINTIYYCQTSINSKTVSFWVEDKLEHYDKFWDKSYPQYSDQILTTNKPLLKKLQHFIYEESDFSYTIIDLQGQENGQDYILCDIEFTSYNYKESMIISRFVKDENFLRFINFNNFLCKNRLIDLYNWEKVTLNTIKKQINEIIDTLNNIIPNL